MLNQRLKSCIDELDADENMKQFIEEILSFEWETFDEINTPYLRTYDNLINKYLKDW